jgi:aminopeptidase N
MAATRHRQDWRSWAARISGGVLLGVLLGGSGCSAGPGSAQRNPAQAPRAAANHLTREDAQLRKPLVDHVAYRLEIDVTRPGESFAGVARIDFELEKTGHDLTVDFAGGSLNEIRVNGRRVEPVYNGFFVTIRGEHLRAGPNVVEIVYTQRYGQDGSGLNRFVDPEDGLTYLYSDLWPYYANRLFPCFDQPDLRATYELSVTVPADWVVSSSTREIGVEAVEGAAPARRRWRFPKSADFSTYLFSLHAGPFHVWEGRAGDIPLRLLSRQSVARFVDAEDWFRWTSRGFAFYQAYFGIPYPYGKYDQIIVPNFNYGAMENVAAVTFGEEYVHRGTPTRDQREALATTILHEMAHMWFGDLVTMEWWNDLWLNESFAELMSYQAQSRSDGASAVWHRFFLDNKRRAYVADRRVTTHPIEAPVADSGSFFLVFDDITYGKGSSVLEQLSHALGEGRFREGVSRYLADHASGNTRLEDFAAALERASGRDLHAWVEQWLRVAGVNTLGADYTCANGRISAFAVTQTAPENWPTLREHRTQIGLYQADRSGGVRVQSVEPVTISGARTEIAAEIGRPCPDMVYPNHGDWDYARVRLDDKTLGLLDSHIDGFESPLLRSMLWDTAWELTRDAGWSPSQFLDLALDNIAEERDDRVVTQVMDAVTGAMDYLLRFRPASQQALSKYGGRVEALAWAQASAAEPGSDLQRIWFDAYTATSRSSEALSRLDEILQGDLKIPGLGIDQDRRWRIIARLNAMGHPGAAALARAERDRDRSDQGKRAAIAAEAGRPDLGIKQKWLAVFQDEASSISLSKQREAMSALFPPDQTELQLQLLDALLAPLPQMSTTRDPYFLSAYTQRLLPGTCRPESVQRLQEAIVENQGRNATVERFLREAHEADARCVKARETSTSRQPSQR